jgi:histidinol-phosphatase (PHP family)
MEIPGKNLVTFISYHNHTTWSDGSATVPEMIESARAAGLKELGFSDHFALVPGNQRIPWALAPELLDSYVAQIRQAMEDTPDITLRLGLEVDYFPETVEQIRQQLAPHPFDYLIGSVHFVGDFPVDLTPEVWKKISQKSRNEIWRGYWQRLRTAAQSGLFDIIGHFDLPKKFKFYPSVDLTGEALAALDAVAAADMAIELNTSGWDKQVEEAYPSLFYLREANRRKIPLIINSDAHAVGEIARYFDRARKLAFEAGYTESVLFERRHRLVQPL